MKNLVTTLVTAASYYEVTELTNDDYLETACLMKDDKGENVGT